MKRILKHALAILLILSLTSCDVISGGHTHTFENESVVQPATCSENGLAALMCPCGEIKNEIIYAKGHSFSEWITEKEATYKETGVKYRTCKCGECERVTVDILRPVFAEGFDGDDLNRSNWSKWQPNRRHVQWQDRK